jgi:hypothetical protein
MRTIEIFIPYVKYNSTQYLTQTFEKLLIGTVVDVSIPKNIKINENAGIAFVKIKIFNNFIGNNFIKNVKQNRNTRIYYNNCYKDEFWDITKYITREKRKIFIQTKKYINFVPFVSNNRIEKQQKPISSYYEYNDKHKINEEYDLLEKEIFSLWFNKQ